MKKLLFALCALATLAIMVPVPGFAQTEYNGVMGIYFDTDALVYETTSAAFVMVPTHIMLTEYTLAAVHGYEFGYEIAGNHMVSGTTLMGEGPIDVGGEPGNHIVGLNAPMAAVGPTILTTLTIFVMDELPIAFTLKGAEPNSGAPGATNPNVVAPPGDILVATYLSASDPGDPSVPAICAYINGTGVIAADEASWDSVKSLYR